MKWNELIWRLSFGPKIRCLRMINNVLNSRISFELNSLCRMKDDLATEIWTIHPTMKNVLGKISLLLTSHIIYHVLLLRCYLIPQCRLSNNCYIFSPFVTSIHELMYNICPRNTNIHIVENNNNINSQNRPPSKWKKKIGKNGLLSKWLRLVNLLQNFFEMSPKYVIANITFTEKWNEITHFINFICVLRAFYQKNIRSEWYSTKF